jgi:hypothetical protein
MSDDDGNVSSNSDLEDPDDMEGGNRPAGGHAAVDPNKVGQHADEMRKRGTIDPDKPDPSGGPNT